MIRLRSALPLAALALAVRAGLGPWPAPDLARAQAPQGKTTSGDGWKLPGAIEAMPPWLRDAPFDAAKYFAMPPAAENAAPLYVEAFAELDGEEAGWLPPDRRAAAEAGKARWKQWSPTIEPYLAKDPASVPPKQADAALAAFADVTRKLDAAQSRPRCAFATGIGGDTIVPHLQSARNVARLQVVQVARGVDRDDFPAAFKGMERSLRLSRDIRARGFVISNLFAIGIDHIAVDQMLPHFLASRKLKPEHCDRLLKLLTDHEAQALDPFRIGVMGEYVTSRVLLRTYAEGIKTVAGPDGRATDVKLDDEALVRELANQLPMLTDSDPTPGATKADAAAKKLPEALAQLRQGLPKLRARLDDETRALLAAPATFPARVAALDEAGRAHPLPPLGLFEPIFRADRRPFAVSSARDTVDLGAARCLVALRRWQLTSTKPPTDLAAVCKAAKLAAVPTDPSGDGPLRLATVGDDLVIYSVGPDGRDDRGLVDSEMGKKPGDMIYRLPKRK